MKKSVVYLLIIACLLFTGCAKSGRSATGEMVSVLSVLFNIGLFVLLGKYSRLLRDDVNDVSTVHTDPLKKAAVYREYPFSLSKVQLGVWTVVISCSYLYLTLFKGGCSEIMLNKTAVVLMGIFSGTAVTSKIMDKRQAAGKTPDWQNRQSQGFFTDILSDEKGVSIHRFQHMLWTLIAITIYLYRLSQITTGCALPELGDTLLALTGISSATYVVMRAGENDANAPPPNKSELPVYQTGLQHIQYPDRTNNSNGSNSGFYG